MKTSTQLSRCCWVRKTNLRATEQSEKFHVRWGLFSECSLRDDNVITSKLFWATPFQSRYIFWDTVYRHYSITSRLVLHQQSTVISSSFNTWPACYMWSCGQYTLTFKLININIYKHTRAQIKRRYTRLFYILWYLAYRTELRLNDTQLFRHVHIHVHVSGPKLEKSQFIK